MATANKNLSSYSTENIINGADFQIGIVVSDWNDHITNRLMEGAIATLLENGVIEANIHIQRVPGAFELPLGAQYFCDRGDIDGAIAIGVVIQGETRHFDFICNAVANGLMQLNIQYKIPVTFGVLTTDNLEQAQNRSGGKHGNKGFEAGLTALKSMQ